MKTGYPFLRISQKYNLPYTEVLEMASTLKNLLEKEKITYANNSVGTPIYREISNALNYFKDQSLGRIPMSEGFEIEMPSAS